MTDQHGKGVLQRVLEIAEQVLKVPCRPDDGFLDLGGTSMQAVEFIALLDESFGVEPDVLDVFDAADFRAIERAVVGAMGGTTT